MPFSCPENTKKIGICLDCYHVDCQLYSNTCSVCGEKLLFAEVKAENYGCLQVEWLSYSSAELGLISISQMSAKIATILKKTKKKPLKDNLKLVICGSKKTSIEFLRLLGRENGEEDLAEDERNYPETSAYAIFIDQGKNIYIALNENSNYPEILDEILSYYPRWYENRMNLVEPTQDKLSLFFGDFVSKFMKKIGLTISEMRNNEELINYGAVFIEDLRNIIAGYYTYRETFDLAKPSSRRKLLKWIFDYTMKNASDRLKTEGFYDGIFIVKQFFQLSLIVLAHNPNAALYNELKRNLLDFYTKLKNEHKQDKILDCLDIISTEFAKMEICEQDKISFDNLLNVLSKSLERLDFSLSGSLKWLGIYDLFVYYLQIPDDWQTVRDGYSWTLHQFMDFIRNTPERYALHISSKLIMRTFWVTLIMQVVKKKKGGHVSQSLLTDLAKVVKGNVNDFLKNEVTLKRCADNALEFEISDLVDDVLEVLFLAEADGFTSVSRDMRKLFNQVAKRRKIGHLEIALKWYDYLKTLDISFLEDILTYDKFIDETNDAVYTTISKIYVELAKGIIDSDKWPLAFQKAEDLASKYPIKDAVITDTENNVPGNFVKNLLLLDLNTSAQMFYQIGTFSMLSKSNSTPYLSDRLPLLKECRTNLELFLMGAMWKDALQHLIIMADVLIWIIKDDREKIKQVLVEHKMEMIRFPVMRGLLETFLNTNLQGTLRYETELTKFRNSLHNLFEDACIDILSQKYKDVFLKLIANSDVVIFLEGEIDVAVFEEIYAKLGYKHILRFLSVGGINNFRTFAETKMIKALGVPAFFVTDGDVLKGQKGLRRKNKIIKDLQIQEKHFMWIPEDQIEDYILEPHLIGLAFQEYNLDEKLLSNFIRNNIQKTSKEKLVGIFHEFISSKSYNPETARRIASQFDKDSIPIDLVKIIENICTEARLKV